MARMITEMGAVLILVVISLTFVLNGGRGQTPQSSPPATNNSSLQVEGFGQEAQKGVGNTLQGAAPVNQSDTVGEDLQKSADDSSVQPNSEESF